MHRNPSAHDTPDSAGDEGFIELALGTLEELSEAGRKRRLAIEAGDVNAGGSHWVTLSSGDRFCLASPRPAPDAETPCRKTPAPWWRRLLTRWLP